MRKLIRLAVVAVAVTSTSGCAPLDDAMVYIFGRSMRNQASFDPYEDPRSPADAAVSFSSGNFSPEPGTVSYGKAMEHDYDVPDFDASYTVRFDPSLDEIQNPVAADAASLERGEELYLRVCAPCHGEVGIGAEAYVVDKWPALVVYNLAQEQVQGYSDGYLYAMVRVGRGNMPQYGHQVAHFDRWHIVNYVRKLQADWNAQQAQDGEN
jgi:mono/diheme cytochrome c family protein